MNISNSLSQILNSIQLSRSEHTFLQTLLHPITPTVKVFCLLSSITIEYPNIWYNSYSLTFLVPMSVSCKPTSHHTFFWKLHSSPFITKLIILEIFPVCLMSLPLLAIQVADLPSNIIRDACYGTISVSFFRNSLFSILKFARAITVVHAALY